MLLIDKSCLCLHLLFCIFTCLSMYAFKCVHVCACVCLYVFLCVCMIECIYMIYVLLTFQYIGPYCCTMEHKFLVVRIQYTYYNVTDRWQLRCAFILCYNLKHTNKMASVCVCVCVCACMCAICLFNRYYTALTWDQTKDL